MLDAVPLRPPPRLVVRALALATGAVLLTAAPAGADAAGPSDFRSEVIGLVPEVDGVEAEVRGGDSFLELRVEEGHEVVVEGYRGEPYLRFREDGTVERNLRSPATYVNDDRRGGGDIPAGADPAAEPDWERVDDGGTYAWHDHRIHWMQDTSPPVVRGQQVGGEYDPWTVPIVVDGEVVDVRGTLSYEEAVSPLPWVAVAAVGAAALAWLGRRHAVGAAAGLLAAAAAVALVVGRADHAATPDGGANPLLWTLPAVALVAAAAGLVPRLRGAAVVAVLASVAALSGWALLRFGVLTKPVLPADVPAWLDRVSVAAALATAAGSAWLAITSGALRLPELPDD
jgi:hypothetical protein